MKLTTIRGLVRPVVALAMAGAIVAGFFLGKLTPDQFLPVATAPILFWFGSRSKKDE